MAILDTLGLRVDQAVDGELSHHGFLLRLFNDEVERREVVCLVGPAGVGKSHLAQALGHRACMAGHKILFTSAQHMFRELRQARPDRSLPRPQPPKNPASA